MVTSLKLFQPTPILDFSIGGTFPSIHLYDIMPFLSNITRLRVEQRKEYHIYPDRIFRGCPHLLSLHVGSGAQFEMFGEWLPFPPDQQQPLPLQYLNLEGAYLKQVKLENFLQFTPRLTNLQLSNLSIKGISAITENARYDCKHLIKCIKRHKVPLETFHFSVYESYGQLRDCLVDEELFRSICQDAREWTFATGDLTPQLFRNIGYLPNTITTLNMVNRDTAFNSSNSKLHQFLCSSPQLLHLRILRTAYHLPYLDLNCRMPIILVGRPPFTLNAELARKPSHSVWACRRLQTLHISFSIPRGNRPFTEAVYSRIAFGYIAKVCPELRELKIEPPTSRRGSQGLLYNLAGGFCLLAGLRHLEVLHLELDIKGNICRIGQHELDWMTLPQRTKSTERSREERSKIVAQWRGELLAEANKDKKRMAKQQLNEFPKTEANTLGWKYCDDELRSKLYQVGLLSDVKTMVERIDSSSEQEQEFKCWPYMQRIGFGLFSEFGSVSAKQELKRLFS
ncbi:hypothetical protein EC991_001070 [Linnemannia zychae]|nr:hypothetical protein EC991_001070 [Linnemannia zychae]